MPIILYISKKGKDGEAEGTVFHPPGKPADTLGGWEEEGFFPQAEPAGAGGRAWREEEERRRGELRSKNSEVRTQKSEVRSKR